MKKTSIEAREKIEPHIGTIRRRVYELFINRGMQGLTDQEIERYLHLDGNTVRPVRKSLEVDGFIFDTGTTRLNEKGNKCIVWRMGDKGMLL
jgi:transcription initiation factor IIE alpha subunit